MKNIRLPDLFLFDDGTTVTSDNWGLRRKEIAAKVIEIGYGGLPPGPKEVSLEVLHSANLTLVEGAKLISCRVAVDFADGSNFGFLLTLMVPPVEGKLPVVINGDGCWRYVSDEVIKSVLQRGFILARFNRTEIAADNRDKARAYGIYRLFPEATFGALAAWAWGYHRVIDALSGEKFVDSERFAVTGHSRGGKTVLVAAATDERIALVGANNSGAAGAGCFRYQAESSETLKELMRNFYFWCGPEMPSYIGRENELPFDQHFLKALVAPRTLLTMEGLGDVWANPPGAWLTHCAAREAFKLLGAEERIAISFRDGGHGHKLVDWEVFLDVMEWQLLGRPAPVAALLSPFAPPPAGVYQTVS